MSLTARRQEGTPQAPLACSAWISLQEHHIYFSDMEIVKTGAVFKATSQVTLIIITCTTCTKQGMTPGNKNYLEKRATGERSLEPLQHAEVTQVLMQLKICCCLVII